MDKPRRPGLRFAAEVVRLVLAGPKQREPRAEAVAARPPADAPVPRNWNIWDIERARRDRGESDVERDYLLMYLRDYAGPDGQLPLEFDGLVRASFGEVLGTPTR